MLPKLIQLGKGINLYGVFFQQFDLGITGNKTGAIQLSSKSAPLLL